MQDPTIYFTLKDFYQAIKCDSRLIGELKAGKDCDLFEDRYDSEDSECQKIVDAIDCFQDMRQVPYCVGSSISSEVGGDLFLRLILEDGGELSQNISSLKPQHLAKCMNKAPFGDIETQTTKVDESVRTAYQMDMEFVQLLIGMPVSPKIDGLPSYVVNQYAPDFFRDIHTEVSELFNGDRKFSFSPYRLNVYGPGGFFKPHVDTPKDKDMIGTLVVILPSEYTGGELTVSHNGDRTTYDFADKKNIHWVAFFSDCVHEVKPITSGHRVSMTFNIIKDQCHCWGNKGKTFTQEYPEWNNLKPTKYRKFGDIITGAIDMYNDQILRSIADSQSNGIGIILSHNYTPDGLTEENLKGRDKFLYEHINPQYSCRLISVVIYYNYEYPYEDSYCDSSDYERVCKIYQLDAFDWPYYYEHGEINPDPEPLDNDYNFISYEGLGRIIQQSEQTAAYTGNESQYGYDCRTYFSAALLIDK